jgi:hypothetical protein
LDDKILELLVSKLEDRKKQLSVCLCDGVVKDFAEYKNLCGEIRGLATAQMEIKDLVRKLKESDDE